MKFKIGDHVFFTNYFGIKATYVIVNIKNSYNGFIYDIGKLSIPQKVAYENVNETKLSK